MENLIYTLINGAREAIKDFQHYRTTIKDSGNCPWNKLGVWKEYSICGKVFVFSHHLPLLTECQCSLPISDDWFLHTSSLALISGESQYGKSSSRWFYLGERGKLFPDRKGWFKAAFTRGESQGKGKRERAFLGFLLMYDFVWVLDINQNKSKQ